MCYRAVLSQVHRPQKWVPAADEGVPAAEGQEGQGGGGWGQPDFEPDQAEELQEHALLQAGLCQLALHEGPHLLHLQEVALPEEILPMLRERAEVRLVLRVPRVREQIDRRLGLLSAWGIAALVAIRGLQALRRERGEAAKPDRPWYRAVPLGRPADGGGVQRDDVVLAG